MGKQYLNGVLYGTGEIIKFSPYIYSLEEREVGVFTDGKPLYQKSYLVDWRPTVVDTIIDNTINTSNIALRSLIGTWSVGNYGYPTAYQVDIHDDCYFGSSNVWVSKPKIFLSDNGLTIRRTQSAYGAWYTITIQYTKTTDTPGSGHYTTNGREAHHYSTSEQIIGKWIDGNTLYEKTITGLSKTVSKGAWTSITYSELGVSDVAGLIDCKAYTEAIGSGQDGYLSFTLGEFCAYPSFSVIQIQAALDARTLDTLTIQYTKSS